MAGFGGGSTYIAMLVVSGVPLVVVPIIALICNLVVTVQGSCILIGKKHADWPLLIPLLSASIPCAFLGGFWRIPEGVFIHLLATALTAAGFVMLWQHRGLNETVVETRVPRPYSLIAIGAFLGLLAGVTGIGGGIYLAPVMHLYRWSKGQSVAACTSIFIALNSLAGLLGQFSKGIASLAEVPLWLLIACPIAVLLGGRVGSSQLSERFSAKQIHTVTAVVILLVAVRLWMRIVVSD